MDRETELLHEWIFKSDDPNISELREQVFIAIKLIHGEQISNQIQIEKEQKHQDWLASNKMMQIQIESIREMFKEPVKIETEIPPSEPKKTKLTWSKRLKKYANSVLGK